MIMQEKEIMKDWQDDKVELSICCVSYNHEEYIKKTLDSFLIQKTNFPFEILIHDDASTDKTAEIIKEYERKYPKIIKPIYQHENQVSKGVRPNIDYLIPKAIGKYIAFCDGDDYWTDSSKLQKQVDFLENSLEFVACAHNTKILNEENKDDKSFVNLSMNKDIFTVDDFTKGEAYFHTSSMVFRNNIELRDAYDLLSLHRGDWFRLIVFSQYGPIKYIDEVMSVYRIHDKGVWSLLDENEKVVKNLKSIIEFNKIFDYKYEDNFLKSFTTNVVSNLTNIKTILKLFENEKKEDLIKFIEYAYQEIDFKNKVIREREQTIDVRDKSLHKIYLSKGWKALRILYVLYSFISTKRVYFSLRYRLKKLYRYFNYNTIDYIFVNNILDLKNNFQILSENKNRISTLNKVIIDSQSALPSITEDVLDISVGVFDKVSIIGGTDALIYEDKLFHQELSMMKEQHDLKQLEIFLNFNIKNKQTLSTSTYKKVRIFDNKNVIYISLLKEHSINYYHWITENIPRLVLSIKEIENKTQLKEKQIVLFIDENMPTQCIEIIDLIMPFEYSIEYIKKAELCKCSNLLYCSPLWNALDNTSGILDHKEFFVDKYALELVHKAIHENLKLDSKPASRRIYLRRKPSQMRSILNNDKVEAYMKSNDFEIIETDTMSFVEQVRLFHEAKIVVGASGATFTNILFMQALSKAIIFFPSHPSINHGIFQPLADVSNIDLIHYHTIPKDMKSIHSDFMVDLDKIEFLLEG